MEKQIENLYLMIAVGFLILGGFLAYSMSQSESNENTDTASINALSSFTVKNNKHAQEDYERLAAYTPKTNKGVDFKAKKVDQKLNELRTFGTK